MNRLPLITHTEKKMAETKEVRPRTGTEVLESIEKIVRTIGVNTTPTPIRKRESEDLKELYKALGDAQMKFRSIEKSGLITGRNIPYAKINDLVDASRAALYENGLVVTTYHTIYPMGEVDQVMLTTRLVHAATGQFVESELPLLNGADEQKRGSSITYAWRYTYAPLLGLVDNSYDDDGEVTKPPSYKK